MNTCSILLVDDFEDGLDMYQEYLTYRGYHVVAARDGQEAIVRARAQRPDVILMDIRMPGITGTDAMRILRSDPTFRRVPIIALTSHALEGERIAALDAGFDELISKPCLPDELALAIERLLHDYPRGQTTRQSTSVTPSPRDPIDGSDRRGAS